MIIKTFDRGWGNQWGWKQFERQVVDQMLRPVAQDSSRTVLINSVWYTGEVDQEVRAWLSNNDWDQIVLVAMLDAAIPRPAFYSEFQRPVFALGYYPGVNTIDLCAVFLEKSTDLSRYGDLLDPSVIDTAFMCLNRKPHWHRRRFYRQLESFGLLSSGLVSMGDDSGSPVRTLPDDVGSDIVAPNSEIDHYGIPNNVCDLGSAANWKKCFFNVVTETFWDINHNYFVSEKIYKPILGMRPFVVYDPDGGVKWLRDRGFETYEMDFRDISDRDPADPDQLVLFLRDLCAQPVQYFRKKFSALVPKLRHNLANLRNYTQQQQQKIQQGLIVDQISSS